MLVIIDLQDYYIRDLLKRRSRWTNLLKSLGKRVELAKKRKEPIVNLVHAEDGCTLPEVLEMLDGYKLKIHVIKYDFDGSKQLIRALKKRRLELEPIELCGIYEDVCVLETWKSLKANGYNVLPIDKNITLRTLTNWRKIKDYPKGFGGCLKKKKEKTLSRQTRKTLR